MTTDKNEIKILSWDVGIKNLAYCLLSKKNDKFVIEKWGLINLQENNKPCQFLITQGKTKGQICGKNSQVEIRNKDNTPFLIDSHDCTFQSCKTHADKFCPTFGTLFDDNKKCIEKKCKSNATKYVKGSDAYCWCQQHYETGKTKFLKRICKKKITGTGCASQGLDITTAKLYNLLDKMPEMMKVDKVLIENQPSLKNPTMKTIASVLYGYFIMRGFVDQKNTNSIINEIKFVSPSNKLRVNKVTTGEVLAEGKISDKVYKMTKKLGIKYCQSLINKTDAELLNNYKKKDDLCDAFLQGFQYLFNPVPQEYMIKLQTIGLETVVSKKQKNEKSDKKKSPEKVSKVKSSK